MNSQSIKKKFPEIVVNFIKKNLKLIIVFLSTILIFLFLYLFYKNLESKKNIEIAEKYTKALILVKQKKTDESKILLENVISKDHKFYSPLALYLIIDNNLENDQSKIISFFDEILKNNSIDKENLNLIKIKKALYLINFDNEKLILETLNPVINSNSVWRNTAINLISTYFLEKKQKAKAEEYIQLLDNSNNK